MSKPKPCKPWPLADAMFVEVEITHPSERQRHLVFQNGVRLVIGDSNQIALAAGCIIQLRKIDRFHATQKGGRRPRMMGLSSHLRIFLCMEPCDMRKSYHGLAALAEHLAPDGLKCPCSILEMELRFLEGSGDEGGCY
jgi:hypothetical protein